MFIAIPLWECTSDPVACDCTGIPICTNRAEGSCLEAVCALAVSGATSIPIHRKVLVYHHARLCIQVVTSAVYCWIPWVVPSILRPFLFDDRGRMVGPEKLACCSPIQSGRSDCFSYSSCTLLRSVWESETESGLPYGRLGPFTSWNAFHLKLCHHPSAFVCHETNSTTQHGLLCLYL